MDKTDQILCSIIRALHCKLIGYRRTGRPDRHYRYQHGEVVEKLSVLHTDFRTLHRLQWFDLK